MLFHPVYSIVNAASCGRLGDTELAALGLGSLTLGIMLESIGTCFSSTVGTPVAIASGAKDYRMCRVYMYRQFYLNSLVYPVLCVPLLFIQKIYTLIG